MKPTATLAALAALLLAAGPSGSALAAQAQAQPLRVLAAGTQDPSRQDVLDAIGRILPTGPLTAAHLRDALAAVDSLATAKCALALRTRQKWTKAGVGLLPHGRDIGRCLWGSAAVEGLDQANVTGNDQSGSLYADLLTTYIGPVRAHLGALVSGATSADSAALAQETLQRVLNGGGNLVLGMHYPWAVFVADRSRVRAASALSFRAASDIQQISDTVSTPARANASLGADARLQVVSDAGDLQLFLFGKGEQVFGANLGPAARLDDPLATVADDSDFGYVQISGGLFLWNTILATWTRNLCQRCDSLGLRNQLSVTVVSPLP